MPTNSFKSKSANFAFCEEELLMKSPSRTPTPPTRERGARTEAEHLAENSANWKHPKTCPYAYATGICIKTRDHLPSAISSTCIGLGRGVGRAVR